ncbi:MAG: sulfotransferase [Thermosynechococcaceae cyanobacterium]
MIDKAAIWAAPRVQNALPSWCFPQPSRRFRAYCIGAAKTGTTTISLMFEPSYRSCHEPEASLVLEKVLDYWNGKIDRRRLASYIRHRDRRLGLEMDASHLNAPLMDSLLQVYEDAKFILTIRDCYSWLDSLFNHHGPVYRSLGNRKSFQTAKWTRFYNHIYGSEKFQYSSQENLLREYNLYTLDGYFSYWAEHNRRAIKIIPPSKLLILRTQDIDNKSNEIEAFLNISKGSLKPKVRGNTRDKTQKLNLLSQLDQDFVEAKANQYCQDLMQRYFPEIKSVQHAGL